MNIVTHPSWKGVALGAVLSVMTVFGAVSPTEAAGLLSPKNGSIPVLEIRDHKVSVIIEDGYAITSIEQVFANPHQQDFEAVYSFPVPEKAAVGEFTYWIDGEPVSGEVLPKQEARKIYEQERAAGRETAITEQDSFKTFDISVYPVRAGQDVRILLSYIQPAHVDTGVGRYLYPLEEGGVDERKASFWAMADAVTGTFSFDLELRPAFPIHSLRLPAHPNAEIKRDAEGDWHVHISNHGAGALAAPVTVDDDQMIPASQAIEAAPVQPGQTQSQPVRLDTDIVVYWRLQSGLPGGVEMITHKEAGSDKGTFMMVLTPGDDLEPIKEGRDWAFVLDVSGSMKSKFHTLAEGVGQALKKLTPEDRFRFVFFNDNTRDTGDFVNATPENIAQAIASLARTEVRGGTNLYAGLAEGLDDLDQDRSAGVVLVTDGVANVGETHKRSFIKLVDKQDVRLFTVIMGNSANRPLLNAISLASGGTAVSVSNSDDVIGAVLNASSKLTHSALHNISIDIDGVRTSDLTTTRIGSLYRGQQLVLFGHYWGSGDATVTLKAKASGEPVSYTTRHTFSENETRNPEIERLWAFAAIEDMMHEMSLFGEDADIKQAVTDLAVANSLVTPFTSMLVVREDIFEKYGIERRNKERLEKEKVAQQQRAAQPAAQQQAVQSHQTYASNQASYTPGVSSGSGGGGSGSIDALMLLLILLAALPLASRLPNRRTQDQSV